ncbi:MAG TPA: hypothetical protein DCP92_21740 [Nitrospiraceae bacterium]|nr:hypothetical protein [Nitrospiraceae bacterium]
MGKYRLCLDILKRGGDEMIASGITILLLSLFLAGTASPDLVVAREALLTDEAKICLGCHGQRSIIKKFENGEVIAAYVDTATFKASAHNSLGCSACHTGFSAKTHPMRRFRSKRQYQIRCSLVCRRCHTVEQMKPVGGALLRKESQGNPVVCSDCHGSHSIMSVSGGKMFGIEEQYCLSCHGHSLTMSFKDGETLSFSVEKSALENSAHNEIACSGCHVGFSSSEHPHRIFKSRREYTLASAENCRRCHFDKYTETRESIHYILISRGDLRAPSCTDCHGFHTVSRRSREKVSAAGKCRKCHQGIYDLYAGSVHGKALLDERNRDVPVCTDCHVAHEIIDPLTPVYRRKIPEICRNCHTDKTIMGKYALSTDITTYVSDFHGTSLVFDKKRRKLFLNPASPVAVCTDCHGSHTIRRTWSSDTAVVKANLQKRCRQCHGATVKNIPDKWLPHYEPSMKKAPIFFIVRLIYKVFIPILVIGLLLQVILHIWRYAMRR